MTGTMAANGDRLDDRENVVHNLDEIFASTMFIAYFSPTKKVVCTGRWTCPKWVKSRMMMSMHFQFVN
jgi:hypothetical protein